MAKKKVEMTKNVCSWCNWSKKDWLWVLVSEGALYLFFWYALGVLGIMGAWIDSLILLVLINIMFFACPVFRKHFM